MADDDDDNDNTYLEVKRLHAEAERMRDEAAELNAAADVKLRDSLSFNPKGLSGQQSRRVQSWGRGKYGATNRGRSLNAAERAAVEDRLRNDGILPRTNERI